MYTKFLLEKPKGKRELGRPRHRWEDTIRMDLKEIGWKGADCICVTQDRDQWWILMNMVITFGFHLRHIVS
jgi:hypothetical protein